jgi:[ribosomal protein S5]-alanine N-acetyltransferase
MHFVIETERLFLRCFTETDASLIYELNLDPDVTRYTYDPLIDLEQAAKILKESILTQYALYNFGRWAVHLKSSGEFIGWCGLKYRSELHEVDLGYRFKKQAWGKGYATESALACIKYGFETLKLKRITGRAVIENTTSIKVLEKCGMTYLGEQVVEGYLHRTYAIKNNPFI